MRDGEETRHGTAGPILAALGAAGGALAALSCCLPVLPLVAAAGLTGTSAFLAAARPWLLALAALLVAFGFYRGWKARQCRRRPSVLRSILLWAPVLLLLVAVLFPQAMANAAADLLARGTR